MKFHCEMRVLIMCVAESKSFKVRKHRGRQERPRFRRKSQPRVLGLLSKDPTDIASICIRLIIPNYFSFQFEPTFAIF